jgi:hypothetical protein
MTSRSEELMARAPMPQKSTETHPEVLEMNGEGGIDRVRTDLPEAEYDRKERGEAALNDALERGRNMRDSAMEMATPLLTGLRSRLSSYATRALGALKTSLGFAGEAKDAVGKTWDAGIDVAQKMPRAVVDMGQFAYEDMVAGTARGIKDAALDAVAPVEVDVEKVGDLDVRILKIGEAISVTRHGDARIALNQERQKLEAERDALLSQRKVRPGLVKAGKVAGAVVSAPVVGAMAVGAGLYAGGRAVKEAAGKKITEIQEERAREKEELRREHEEACIARAELFLEAAAEESGEPVQKLSEQQLFILGTKLEDSIARRMVNGLKEVGKGVTFYEDLFGDDRGDAGLFANLNQGRKDFIAFAKNPEDRAWLANELRNANIEIGKALEDAVVTVGKRAIVDPIKRGSGAVGRAGAAAVTGAVGIGAGLALAGAEAAINSRPAKAAKEAVIRKYQQHKPAVERGLASTVTELNQFGSYAVDVPDAVSREVNKVAQELNDNAAKALSFAERMHQRVKNAIDVAQKAWNEIRRAFVNEEMIAKQPEIVAAIDRANESIDELAELPDSALESLDPTDVPTPRAVKSPVIRQVRGSGVNRG